MENPFSMTKGIISTIKEFLSSKFGTKISLPESLAINLSWCQNGNK